MNVINVGDILMVENFTKQREYTVTFYIINNSISIYIKINVCLYVPYARLNR